MKLLIEIYALTSNGFRFHYTTEHNTVFNSSIIYSVDIRQFNEAEIDLAKRAAFHVTKLGKCSVNDDKCIRD